MGLTPDDHYDDYDEGTIGRIHESTVDNPCQLMGYCKTLNYCGGTSAIESMTLCNPNMQFLSVFRSYNDSHVEDDVGASPYIYSSSAPIGPTSCEYCGRANAEECESNLPSDCYRHSQNGKLTNANNSMIGTHDYHHASLKTDKGNDSAESDTTKTTAPCPRPKLFFLKKKPPFATPEGWNPKTDYRNALHEPPTSSMEARMAAWGEVRGAVGRKSSQRSSKGGYHNSHYHGNASSSANGYGESEVSFTSDAVASGSINGGGRVASEGNGSDRPMSPVHWVSGLLEKL